MVAIVSSVVVLAVCSVSVERELRMQILCNWVHGE